MNTEGDSRETYTTSGNRDRFARVAKNSKPRNRQNSGPGSEEPSPAVIDRVELFERHLEWASAIARNVHRKVPPSFDIDDLIQEALIALWKRCELFDQQAGVPFQGYAYIYVRGAVLMAVRRRSWTEATMESLDFIPGGEQVGEGRDVDQRPLIDASIEADQEEQFHHGRLLSLFSTIPPPVPEAILLVRAVCLDGVDLDELARERSVSRKELARALDGGVRQLRKFHPSPVLERFDIPVVAQRIRSRPFKNGLPARFASTLQEKRTATSE